MSFTVRQQGSAAIWWHRPYINPAVMPQIETPRTDSEFDLTASSGQECQIRD
jgi:hypothetical protein